MEEEEELVEDEDAPQLDEAFLGEISGFQDDDQLSKTALKRQPDALRVMVWGPVTSEFETGVDKFPGLVEEEAHPGELRRIANGPLHTFMFFMPKSLWVKAAQDTTRYSAQQVTARAQQIRARQQAGEHRTTETLKIIRRHLCAKVAYAAHELLHVLELLVGHMLSPDSRRFSNH